MPIFTLGEAVRAQRLALNTSPEGAELCYRPDRQILGRAAIVEVFWPAGAPGARAGSVEVSPDGEGGLSVAPAELADLLLGESEPLSLPTVPVTGWRHEPGCTCGPCRSAATSAGSATSPTPTR